MRAWHSSIVLSDMLLKYRIIDSVYWFVLRKMSSSRARNSRSNRHSWIFEWLQSVNERRARCDGLDWVAEWLSSEMPITNDKISLWMSYRMVCERARCGCNVWWWHYNGARRMTHSSLYSWPTFWFDSCFSMQLFLLVCVAHMIRINNSDVQICRYTNGTFPLPRTHEHIRSVWLLNLNSISHTTDWPFIVWRTAIFIVARQL